MPSYHRLGSVPRKRHAQHRAPDGRLLAEEVFGAEGFSGRYSLLYHHHLPPATRSSRPERLPAVQIWRPETHRHHHLRTTELPTGGDPVRDRRLLLFNDDVRISLSAPDRPQAGLFKNGTANELVFVHAGGGVLGSQFGELPVQAGDYVYVPKGTVQEWRLDGDRGRLLVIETPGQIDTPSRYRNDHGQLLERAPFSERDVRRPEQLPGPATGPATLLLKIGLDYYCQELEHHPFDVAGWDGYLYPYAFNIADFEPRSGRFHVPPTDHQTFQGPGFVVCSFVPRPLDWDETAVPIPYYHSNLDSDEVLYYVGGSYSARKVEVGSITLHPRGLSHGPSAGAVEASLEKPRWTDEVAVMVDTFRPLQLAAVCAGIDDPAYARGWDAP